MSNQLQHTLIFSALLFLAISLASCNGDDVVTSAPKVSTSAITEITATTAKGGGTIEDKGNLTITAYGLAYSSTSALPTISDSKTELTTAATTFTSVMENLKSGTTYHVRAYATNSMGTSYGTVVDFNSSNTAPTAKDLSITGSVMVGQTLTAVYTYNDGESDAESGSTFKWYIASSAAGTDEAAIEGATEKTYEIQDEDEGKFLRFGVTPKAGAGITTGLEVKSAYTASVAPETVKFTYNSAEVTYGVIKSQKTGIKWLDRNLGALQVATSSEDYMAYGDLFQWGRLADGHQLTIRAGGTDADASSKNGATPNASPWAVSDKDDPGINQFITTGESPNDWRVPQNNNLWQGVNGANNPCPSGWRLATIDEWNAEEISDLTDGYNKFKLTKTGARGVGGLYSGHATTGYYWTSTIGSVDATRSTVARMNPSYSSFALFRGAAFAIRCVK